MATFLKYTLIFFCLSIIFFSCKREKPPTITNNGADACAIDSIYFENGYSFYFKYNGNKIDEITVFRSDRMPINKITYLYEGNLLKSKIYFSILLQLVTRRYECKYSADLLYSFTHYQINQSGIGFYKARSTELTYSGRRLSKATISSFNSSDSLNPISSLIYNYYGSNDAVDSLFSNAWFITGDTYTYKVLNQSNPMRKNNFYINDPVINQMDLMFDPVILPVLINEKYTVDIYRTRPSTGVQLYSQIRTGVNGNGFPLFFSWSNYNADYYYKCN